MYGFTGQRWLVKILTNILLTTAPFFWFLQLKITQDIHHSVTS